jgi:uncharacterized protein (TIGR03435 family)
MFLRSLFLLAIPLAQTPDWQSAAGGKMAFEVASIKPSDPDNFRSPTFPLDPGDAYATTGGRFSADFPLSVYIAFAYKLTLTRDQREAMLAHLPKWVSSDRFTIQAKSAESNPTKDQMRLMMQSLLAERFKLVVHFETQQLAEFALTLIKPGKHGPNLVPHADGPPCDGSGGLDVFPKVCHLYSLDSKGGRYLGGSRDTTMELIAGSLPSFGRLSRPVVDQTGLTGRFDFKLEWVPDSTSPSEAQPDGPSFIEALREQLGMKLESIRGPVQTLIIDRIERPSEN